MKRYTSHSVLLFLFVCFGLMQCNSEKQQDKVQLPVDQITGHTSGLISRATKIFVAFSEGYLPPAGISIDLLQKSVIEITPKIAGAWVEGAQGTIVFTPNQLLPSDTKFKVRINLEKLGGENHTGKSVYEFNFFTGPLQISAYLDHLKISEKSQLDYIDMGIQFQSSDVMTFEEISSLIKIQSNGASPNISWLQTAQGSLFTLDIHDIKRAKDNDWLSILWDGKVAGSRIKGSEKFAVPAKGAFELYHIKVEPEGEHHLLLSFTELLSPGQDFSSLIQIQGYLGNLRFLVEGNNVRLYHDENLSGSKEIIISENIKNTIGKTLGETMVRSVFFAPPKPAVRIIGRGNIIPVHDENYILPIETINLHSVDIEIFQIFGNNLLQYMQMDDYETNYNMYRVGRIIHQETVKLDPSENKSTSRQWQRHGVDLSKLFAADDQSIYQVRIGFRPEHVTLPCVDGLTTQAPENLSSRDQLESFYDTYYGWAGEWNDSYWKDSDNPCKMAYYSSDHFVSRTLFATDMGLIVKQSAAGDWSAFTSTLESVQPISEATITFFDFQQQVIQQGATNINGAYSAALDREPFLVIAQKGKVRSILKVRDGSALQLSRFDISGITPQKGLKGMIYGEREVWRPGDSLYLNFILESSAPDNDLPPIQCVLIDPNGNSMKKFTPIAKNGVIYDIRTATDSESKTGDYQLLVKVGGATFYKNIKIETIKPNRLKIDFESKEKIVSHLNSTLSGKLSAAWLHGAIANGLKAEIEMSQSDDNRGFDSFKNYDFLDPARKASRTAVKIFDGTLDATGQANIAYKLPTSIPLAGPQQLSLKTTVYEKGGDFSIDFQSIKFSPFIHYVGIQLPKDEYNQNRLDINRASKIDFIAVNEAGTPQPNKDLNIGIYQLQWRWWWDSYEDYIQNYNSGQHTNAIQTYSVRTNSDGRANLSVSIPKWGRYLIRVCSKESGHCSGAFAYVGYPVSDDEFSNESMSDESNILQLKASKDKYAPDDNIQISIPSAAEGKALVSIENGSTVLESKWHDIKVGNNIIKFKATKEMVPNVYANVLLVQGQKGMVSHQPLRMYGILPIIIEDKKSKLSPKIKMQDELEGDAPFVVEVSESQGNPMSYTISIVDEGLLNITRFKTPNPYGYFFAKEALGVKTWDFYDQILSRYYGHSGRMLSVGGDASVKIEGAPTPNRFPPVVMHAGPFYLDANKKTKHTFQMPNYAGAVRVMVVGANHRQYGNEEKSVKVRKSLMVIATLPRVLGPDETFLMPINVFSLEKKVSAATVTITEKNGLASFPEGNTLKVSFSDHAEQLVFVPVKISGITGIASFEVVTSGGGQTAKYEAVLVVRNPNPSEIKTYDFAAASGASINPSIELGGIKADQSIQIMASSFPTIDLAGQLQYLIDYPHGCMEQVISKAFPMLFLSEIAELSPNQKRLIPIYVRQAIEKIQRNLTNEGSLGNWPGDRLDPWISTYALHFLSSAEQKGYLIDKKMMAELQKGEAIRSKTWTISSLPGNVSKDDYMLQQAYRLYVLALSGKSELASMNIFRELKDLSNTPLYLLAGAYGHSGRVEVGRKLVANKKPAPLNHSHPGNNYSSLLRDKGLILQSLNALKLDKNVETLGIEIIEEINSSPFLSTQTIAHLLTALSAFYQNQAVDENLKFAYTINRSKSIEINNKNSLMIIESATNGKATLDLTFKNNMKGKLYIKINVKTIPPPGKETRRNNDIDIKVAYVDSYDNPIEITKLDQGTDFVAKVTITRGSKHPGFYKDIAVTQIFPSGWEISNPRIFNQQTAALQSNMDFQDIRDDRVLTYINLSSTNQITFKIPLKATYNGRFYLPSHKCESMYNELIQSGTTGKWVEVLKSPTIRGEG